MAKGAVINLVDLAGRYTRISIQFIFFNKNLQSSHFDSERWKSVFGEYKGYGFNYYNRWSFAINSNLHDYVNDIRSLDL